MKKLMIMVALATTVLFASCEKETNDINYKKAAFGGMLSSKGKLTINGKPAVLNTVYDVKKGDVLKFVDTGDDINHPGQYLYSTTGLPPICIQQPYTEQGVTYGEIIIETGSVLNSYGKADVNLTYTVN